MGEGAEGVVVGPQGKGVSVSGRERVAGEDIGLHGTSVLEWGGSEDVVPLGGGERSPRSGPGRQRG